MVYAKRSLRVIALETRVVVIVIEIGVLLANADRLGTALFLPLPNRFVTGSLLNLNPADHG